MIPGNDATRPDATGAYPVRATPEAPLKLVVPTSFSHKSRLALEFAITYSQSFHATVYLFHVIPANKSKDFRDADRYNEKIMERMRQTVGTVVEQVHQMGIHPSVERIHRRTSTGKPWQEITRIASGINADMVIMGHPRQTGFKKMVMSFPCSLVLLKPKDPEFVVA